MRQDFLIGQDVRGQDLYMTDFQKDFGVLRRCKKLTAEGRKLKKISKYYKSSKAAQNYAVKLISKDKENGIKTLLVEEAC